MDLHYINLPITYILKALEKFLNVFKMHFHEEEKNPQKEHELKSQQSAIKNSELN